MVWPFRLRRSKTRAKLRKRSARNTKSINGASAASTPSDVGDRAVSNTTGEVADSSGAAASGPAVATYACHYCERTDGSKTRDHKLPRMFGGTGLPGVGGAVAHEFWTGSARQLEAVCITHSGRSVSERARGWAEI